MKVSEVPQDDNINYEGHKKLRYGRDEAGKMSQVGSTGCLIEEEATSFAWQDIRTSLGNTLKKVHAGELSPLAYHIEKKLMTYDLLASNMGVWKWKVKRHMRPNHFAKLSQDQLENYASYLEMTSSELKTVPEKL